jgi:hyperosmotically inducible protein
MARTRRARIHRALLGALAAALVSSGCVYAAVGGAAAATGLYVATEDRSPAQLARDAAISTQVKTRLLRDKHVRGLDVNVDTRNNRVTLWGHVPNQLTAERAVLLARRTKNVEAVVSHLEVAPPR